MKNPYIDTYKWVLAHANDQICSCFHLFVQLITPEPCIWLMSSHLHLQVWTAHPQHAKQTQNKQILTSQRLSNGILLLICCHGAALWKGGRKDKHQSPFPHLWWLLLFGGEGGVITLLLSWHCISVCLGCGIWGFVLHCLPSELPSLWLLLP